MPAAMEEVEMIWNVLNNSSTIAGGNDLCWVSQKKHNFKQFVNKNKDARISWHTEELSPQLKQLYVMSDGFALFFFILFAFPFLSTLLYLTCIQTSVLSRLRIAWNTQLSNCFIFLSSLLLSMGFDFQEFSWFSWGQFVKYFRPQSLLNRRIFIQWSFIVFDKGKDF